MSSSGANFFFLLYQKEFFQVRRISDICQISAVYISSRDQKLKAVPIHLRIGKNNDY
mgnify:CR=1 FL=1